MNPVALLADQSGFTLIELLGVAVISIILALMSLPIYAEVTDRARMAKSADELRVIEQALERYKTDQGQYPANLGTLVTAGYLKSNTRLESPWSGRDHQIFYFYAVDRTSNYQAYALGDPGVPRSGACTAGTMHASATAAMPCGRSPWGGTAAYSFSELNLDTDFPLVYQSVVNGQVINSHMTLRGYRSDLKTES